MSEHAPSADPPTGASDPDRTGSLCPELGDLEATPWTPATRAHVDGCGSCKLVVELLAERSQAEVSRDRRDACARFEALIAVRVGGELGIAAARLLDEHLAACAACRAIADTMIPAGDRGTDHATLPAIDPHAYALGAEIARGGMGRVVSARDLRIGRPVAVKELLARSVSHAARFEREARVTARLQHPGIVPIYEIGRWEGGTPFYAMRLVTGRTLRAAIGRGHPLELRLALLPAVIAATEAVAFAHASRVIHRDLTPANVMIGDFGETVVIDWGLAKDLSDDGDDDVDVGPYRRDPTTSGDLTAVGAVLGTAPYMPPEQARGERVDERADVYALGAILYHLLADQPPYSQRTADEVLAAVRAGPPAPLPADAPRDLTSIVGKAMARDPADRYPSARELAAELTAFTTGRLVRAHEYTRGELIRRWIRKRRAVLTVAALALTALAVVGVLAVRRIVEERDVADGQRAAAEQQRARSQALSTTLLVEQGRQEALAGHAERAAALLAEAYKADPTDRVTRQLLGQVMRVIEAAEPWRPATRPGVTTIDAGNRIEVSADGSRLLVRSGSSISVAEARPGSPMITATEHDDVGWPHLSADGRLLAGVDDETLRVWSAVTGKLVWSVSEPGLSWAGFSRDGGAVIAIAVDGGWGVWDATSGAQRRRVRPSEPATRAGPAANAATAIVGDLLAIATQDGSVSVWDWRRGERLSRFEHGGELTTPFSAAFDGATVLTCGSDGRIRRWDARSGRLIATMIEASGAVLTCSLGPDGEVATSSIAGTVRVWSPGGVVISSVETARPSVVRFSPDGSRVLQQFEDRDVTVLDPATGTVVARLGTSAIVGMHDDRVFLFRADGAVDVAPLHGGTIVRDVHWWLTHEAGDHDLRALLVQAPGGQLSLLDVATRRSVPLPIAMPSALSGDGSAAVGWGAGGITVVAPTGQVLRVIATEAAPLRLAISDDARRIAATFVGGRVLAWDARTGGPLGMLEHQDHDRIDFDDVGRVLLWTEAGPLSVWDPTLPRPVSIAPRVSRLDYSADGALIAFSDDQYGVSVFDPNSGERKLLVPGATHAAFDRAGGLVLRSEDEISIWSTATWKRVRRFPIASRTSAAAVAVSPDGSLIATSDGLWETGTGRQLATFDRGLTPVTVTRGNTNVKLDYVSFSRDGHELIIQTATGARVWNVRPETRAPDEVSAIVARRQPWRVVDGRLVLPRVEAPEPAITSARGRATYRGAAVAGASVVVQVDGGFVPLGVTGADGSFEIALAPGTYAAYVSSAADGAFAGTELIASERPASIEVPLTFEASIAGRVIDRAGRPWPNAIVTATNAKASDGGTATTGADGRFRIPMLRGEMTYQLAIVDGATGAPLATARPLPEPEVATGQSHVDGLELSIDDEPSPRGERIDPSRYYRLATRWAPGRSLDAADDRAGLQLRATGPFGGHLWKLTAVGDRFRLTSSARGDALALGADADGIVLVERGADTWSIDRAADGSYRVQRAGDPRCLAGGLRLALVPCADTADQQWLLTPTTARTTPPPR